MKGNHVRFENEMKTKSSATILMVYSPPPPPYIHSFSTWSEKKNWKHLLYNEIFWLKFKSNWKFIFKWKWRIWVM